MQIRCSCFLKPNSKVKLVTKELEKNSDFIIISSLVRLFLKKKLPLEILEQIKDFNHENLTSEQEKFLVELIPSKEWREHYKSNGLCANCRRLNGGQSWCQPCNLSHLEANFAHWTSGNPEIDKLIQKCQLEARNLNNMLEWIPYEQFTNIEYLAEGGFGKVYRAEWIDGRIKGWSTKNNKWERWGRRDTVLKSLTNSQNITADFLREIINHKLVVRDSYSSIVDCYGISQAPDTGNYVMVMRYIEGGNLRQFLQDNYQQLSFSNRLFQLFNIVQGLQSIHETNLVHHDFHPGNLLNLLHDNCSYIFITDLGLSRPANEINKEKIYGVLPYVAPEVLRKKKYTAAADIYSFGMIAYELFSGKHPFYEYVHDGEFYRALAFRICEGLRPNLKEVIAPQLLRDLISRCWDAQPEQRPTAGDLWSVLRDWLDDNFLLKKHTEFYHQYQELLDIKVLNSLTSKQPLNCSVEKSISQLLDFPNLPQPQNSKELNEQFYGGSKNLELSPDELAMQENSQEIDINISKRFVNSDSQKIDLIDNFAELTLQKESYSDTNKWKNIHPNFTPELVNSWISHNFTYEQCSDWIHTNSPNQQNLAIQEPEYYAWLRDVKKIDSEWVHNYGDSEQLKQEFRQREQEQLKTQIQIPTQK